MIEGMPFNKHKSKQEHLMKENVICSIAGGWQKQIRQPYGLVLTGRNQSQRVHNHGITMANHARPKSKTSRSRTSRLF